MHARTNQLNTTSNIGEIQQQQIKNMSRFELIPQQQSTCQSTKIQSDIISIMSFQLNPDCQKRLKTMYQKCLSLQLTPAQVRSAFKRITSKWRFGQPPFPQNQFEEIIVTAIRQCSIKQKDLYDNIAQFRFEAFELLIAFDQQASLNQGQIRSKHEITLLLQEMRESNKKMVESLQVMTSSAQKMGNALERLSQILTEELPVLASQRYQKKLENSLQREKLQIKNEVRQSVNSSSIVSSSQKSSGSSYQDQQQINNKILQKLQQQDQQIIKSIKEESKLSPATVQTLIRLMNRRLQK